MRGRCHVPFRPLLVAAAVTVVACNALFGIDGLSFDRGSSTSPSGSGASTSSSSSGTAGGGTGGGGAAGGESGGGGEGGSAGWWPVPTGAPLWAIGFGGSGLASGESVAVDPDGNVIVAGIFTGQIDLGGEPLTSAGGTDIFLLALDASGKHRWSKRFGGSADDLVGGVAVTPAGLVGLTGSFRGTIDFGGLPLSANNFLTNVYVAVFASNGKHLYSNAFGDSAAAQQGLAVAVDGKGNLAVAGEFWGSIDFGCGALTANLADAFLSKLSAVGGCQWASGFGAGGGQTARAVAFDPGGDVLLSGDFDPTIDLGSGVHTSAGDRDIFVARRSASGDPKWSRGFGGPARQQATALAPDQSGHVIVGGKMQGTVDFGGGALTASPANENGIDDVYVLALDHEGTHLWSRRYGDDLDQDLLGLAIDSANDVVFTGEMEGTLALGDQTLTSAGGNDLYVVKLDPAGEPLWSYRFGDQFDQSGRAVAAAPEGAVVVTGGFAGSLDFGASIEVLTAKGTGDVFVVMLAY